MNVVWLCHFSNSRIREKLPLVKSSRLHDFAPWISNLISEMEKIPDIELHIVAPHAGLKKNWVSFNMNGVFYHFFRSDMPFCSRNWPSFLPIDKMTDYWYNRVRIQKKIRQINPDIVNLHGAENAYYSTGVIGLKGYPVFVTIQGIFSNPDRFSSGMLKPVPVRIRVERRIHREFKYFGIFPKLFADLIRRDNPNPILLWRSYVHDIDFPTIQIPKEKTFDFVFFGRISEVKGVEKILEAIHEIKKIKPDVSLSIIGPTGGQYYEFLKSLAKRLGINENVSFTGFLPTFQDVFSEAVKAHVSVISSRFDDIPGTIFESVALGLPVAATSVGGIPYLNKDGETILLSRYGDIEGLAKNMLTLLNDKQYAAELTSKCKQFIFHEFAGTVIAQRFLKQYHAIIEHQRHGTEIPEDLKFNDKVFNNNK